MNVNNDDCTRWPVIILDIYFRRCIDHLKPQPKADLVRKDEAGPKSANAMYNSACFHALSDDLETALDCLESAANLGARNKRMWESDKDFDNIRDHPRFKALLERI